MKLFGSSGIRGVANIEITPQIANRLGMALASIHEGGEVVIGRDSRVTGPMLEEALSSGLISCGADANLVGLLPTPVIAWLTKELGADAGVSITASHNPAQYNGFKVFNSQGMSLLEEEQTMVEEFLQRGNSEISTWDMVGSSSEQDLSWMYIDALQMSFAFDREWKIACDLFCGATTSIADEVFKAVGLKANIINGHPDGHFPAGDPEPTYDSLRRLGEFVKVSGAEIGFGFDGDGDRVMVVDEKGTPVSGDRLLAAYAGHVVMLNGGGKIVTHVGASMCIDKVVEAAGGKVIRTRVGDAYIIEEMEKYKAVFGGEPIGAWVLPELNKCPDGILSSLKLLEALEDNGIMLSEFVAQVPSYPTKSVKIETKNKEKVLLGIDKGYEDVFGYVESINRVDGIRLKLPEGWILMRPSGTEPVIRLTAEGVDEKSTDSLIERGKRLIKENID